VSVLNPHVHLLSDDAAVIAYTTLKQHLDKFVYTSVVLVVVVAASPCVRT